MSTDTAVILAAGMGIRLRSFIGEIPKALLTIHGTTLMKRSINLLGEQGISIVYVVTGFKHEKLEKALNDWELRPEVRFVHNPDYSESGSMESLSRMENLISGDFLLLESDLLYERMALSALLYCGQKDSVLISGFTGSSDEVWIHGEEPFYKEINLEKGKIKKINKKPDPLMEIQGELVGISWFSLELYEAMCSFHQQDRSKTYNYHYEEILSNLCSVREINYLKIPDLIWAEIDMESHFERAKTFVYPKILRRDSFGQ